MAFSFATAVDPSRLILSVNLGHNLPVGPFDSGSLISFWYLHDGNNLNTSPVTTLFSLNPDSETKSVLNVYFPDADTISIERWDDTGIGGFVDLPFSDVPTPRDGWHYIQIYIVNDTDVNLYVDGVKAKLNHSAPAVVQEVINMEMGSRAGGASADYAMLSGAVCDFKIYTGGAFDPDLVEVLSWQYAVFPRQMQSAANLVMWTPLTFRNGTTPNGADFMPVLNSGWQVNGGVDGTDAPVSWAEDDDQFYWPPTQLISPSGIASAELVNKPVLDHRINFTGIPSASAQGTPSLAHRINFTGIPSASAQGTPSLDHRINFTGIASTTALGTPSLAQALSMFGIASTAALGLPALDHRINFTGIASTTALGTPSLAQVLAFTGIPSATSFGVPALDHRINFTGIASAETLGTPALDHRISFVGIPSAEALGTPQLALLITFTGIASAETLGTPALDHRIIFTGIPSAEALGIPSLIVSRREALALVAHIGRVLVEAGIGPGVAAESALRAVAELVRAGKITLTGRAGDAPTAPALGGGIEFRVSFPQE